MPNEENFTIEVLKDFFGLNFLHVIHGKFDLFYWSWTTTTTSVTHPPESISIIKAGQNSPDAYSKRIVAHKSLI